ANALTCCKSKIGVPPGVRRDGVKSSPVPVTAERSWRKFTLNVSPFIHVTSSDSTRPSSFKSDQMNITRSRRRSTPAGRREASLGGSFTVLPSSGLGLNEASKDLLLL